MYSYSLLLLILLSAVIFYVLVNRENFTNLTDFYNKKNNIDCSNGKCEIPDSEDSDLEGGSIREMLKFRNEINKSTSNFNDYNIKNNNKNRSIQDIFDSATKQNH
jgi:hypothetical protein